MKKSHLIVLFSFLCTSLTAQEQAWVFFTDKPNSETQLQTPSLFLTQKALLRKQKHSIPIDVRDLPIENDYINTIKSQTGITFLATSKWFNALYIEGEQTDIEALLTLSFVESVFYMDRSLNTSAAAKKLKATNTNTLVNKAHKETMTDFVYGTTQTQIEQLNLQALHNENYTGNDITIAIMDNGFNNVNTISAFDRARENNLLLGGYDFEDKTEAIYDYTGGSHGTNVLSTMLGFIENEFVGTAIDAQYYLFRTEVDESESPKEEAYWIAAAERADSLGVDIINTSLGYSDFDDSKYDYTTSDMDGKTTFISQASTIALEKGMLPVNSAGNSGNSAWGIITAPADSPGALSIGAVDANGNLASFSSVGPTADGRIKPDVMAMGVASTVITENGTIATSQGTSFSSPIMAGAVACFWQSMPNKSPQEIMDLVRTSGNLANNPNTSYGYGIPNFGNSILSIDSLTINDSKKLLLIKNPVTTYLSFNYPEAWISQKYLIYNLAGAEVQNGILTEGNDVNVSKLSTGIYFFKSLTNSNIIKFAKQ